MKCEITKNYDPRVFTREPRQVTNSTKEKRRRLTAAVKSSSKAACGKTVPGTRRRKSSFANRIAALKRSSPTTNFRKRTLDFLYPPHDVQSLHIPQIADLFIAKSGIEG
ncbi:hypothetical protein SprV_0301321800 [Sparganum proliferum]